VSLIQRIMPFLIGGLAGALITVELLVIFDERNSRSASSREHAAGSGEHAETTHTTRRRHTLARLST
jgi:hypothetical protein